MWSYFALSAAAEVVPAMGFQLDQLLGEEVKDSSTSYVELQVTKPHVPVSRKRGPWLHVGCLAYIPWPHRFRGLVSVHMYLSCAHLRLMSVSFCTGWDCSSSRGLVPCSVSPQLAAHIHVVPTCVHEG